MEITIILSFWLIVGVLEVFGTHHPEECGNKLKAECEKELENK